MEVAVAERPAGVPPPPSVGPSASAGAPDITLGDPLDGVTQDEETDPRLWVAYPSFAFIASFSSLCSVVARRRLTLRSQLAASPLYRLFQSLPSPTERAVPPAGLRPDVHLYEYQLVRPPAAPSHFMNRHSATVP